MCCRILLLLGAEPGKGSSDVAMLQNGIKDVAGHGKQKQPLTPQWHGLCHKLVVTYVQALKF